MRFILTKVLLLLAFSNLLYGQAIIPLPVEYLEKPGYFSLFQANLLLDDPASQELNWAVEALKPYIPQPSGQSHPILITRDTLAVSHPEGYVLEVTPAQVVLRYRHPAGAFYGVKTLVQMIDDDNNIPCATIRDYPRFSYRGMHLDVSRHFFSAEQVKKYIDTLAKLKMNRFHWHLTDDQGWRIEIKRYPRLQEIAAFRPQTLKGHYEDQPWQFDGIPHGGFYTQEEVQEMVQYARERFITIIPEIEMPGHAQALLAAYPELSCHGNPVEVGQVWGVFDNILCPTDSTFRFLENVLTEVAALFPGPYIHIGGDEVPKAQWKQSAFCQQLMRGQNLQSEEELQSYFILQIEKILRKLDKRLIGWDEILEGGLSPEATVMSWRGMQGGIAAAQQGHDVIMSPTSHCYFDYYQSSSPDEPLAIGGYLPLEKVYAFEPVPAELTPEQSRHILGAQGNVWTEYLPTWDRVEYMAFPRAVALAEVVWSPADKRDYENFLDRLVHFLPQLGVAYGLHEFEVRAAITPHPAGGLQIAFSNRNNNPMHYQMEGDTRSRVYSDPIGFKFSQRIRAWRVDDQAHPIGNTWDQLVYVHRAAGKLINIDPPPHPNYQLGGATNLVNGLLGSQTRFGDGQWLGWWGKDLEAVIDLGQEQEIQRANMRFFQGQGQWIYPPEKVMIWYSVDGKHYQIAETEEFSEDNPDKIVSAELSFAPVQARFWKIQVHRYGIIPEGKQGAGQEAWFFLDEIMLF